MHANISCKDSLVDTLTLEQGVYRIGALLVQSGTDTDTGTPPVHLQVCCTDVIKVDLDILLTPVMYEYYY